MTESVSITKDTLYQPDNISCLETGVSFEDALPYLGETDIYASYYYGPNVQANLIQMEGVSMCSSGCVCGQRVVGGNSSVFASNSAGASGGAVATEGDPLASWHVAGAHFTGNR